MVGAGLGRGLRGRLGRGLGGWLGAGVGAILVAGSGLRLGGGAGVGSVLVVGVVSIVFHDSDLDDVSEFLASALEVLGVEVGNHGADVDHELGDVALAVLDDVGQELLFVSGERLDDGGEFVDEGGGSAGAVALEGLDGGEDLHTVSDDVFPLVGLNVAHQGLEVGDQTGRVVNGTVNEILGGRLDSESSSESQEELFSLVLAQGVGVRVVILGLGLRLGSRLGLRLVVSSVARSGGRSRSGSGCGGRCGVVVVGLSVVGGLGVVLGGGGVVLSGFGVILGRLGVVLGRLGRLGGILGIGTIGGSIAGAISGAVGGGIGSGVGFNVVEADLESADGLVGKDLLALDFLPSSEEGDVGSGNSGDVVFSSVPEGKGAHLGVVGRVENFEDGVPGVRTGENADAELGVVKFGGNVHEIFHIQGAVGGPEGSVVGEL